VKTNEIFEIQGTRKRARKSMNASVTARGFDENQRETDWPQKGTDVKRIVGVQTGVLVGHTTSQ